MQEAERRIRIKAVLVMEMPENCLEYPCDDVCGESCQVMDGIVEGKENMERLTERTGEGQAIPRMDLKNNGHQRCMERLAEYEDLDEKGRLLIVPKIKKNKTLYWVWGNEIMPVLFKRITSCVVDDKGNPHIMCEMETKKDRTFVSSYKRKPIEYTLKAGDKRYFYSGDIGKTVFLTREDAEAALKELERGKGE